MAKPNNTGKAGPRGGGRWRGRRKNHGQSKPAATLAEAALRRLVPDERLALTRVQLAWSRAVPVQMQRVAWPAAIAARGTVVLHVVDNQWLHEMSYLRSDLLGRLRRAADGIEIKDLRLRVGEIQVIPPSERPPPPPPPALSAEPERSTIDAMESVQDPTLRQAIANARLALGQP